MSEEKVTEKIIQKSKDEIKAKSRKLEKLEVVWMPCSALKPNWYNPNRQNEFEFELLCKSMREDGFTQPVIARREDMTIVDGEHRWRAAMTLGYEEIPVVIVDMSLEQMMISTLRHNRARGSEDMELVSKVLGELKELGAFEWAKDSLMAEDAELRHLFEEVGHTGLTVDVQEEFQTEQETDNINNAIQAGTAVFVQKDDKGRDVLSSLTREAADRVREREKELKTQFRGEQTAMWTESRDLVMYSFVYTKEEAKIVRAVIGTEAPADQVLSICREVLNA